MITLSSIIDMFINKDIDNRDKLETQFLNILFHNGSSMGETHHVSHAILNGIRLSGKKIQIHIATFSPPVNLLRTRRYNDDI